MDLILMLLVAALAVFVTFIAFAKRYKRCPSDRILVVYGKIAGSGRGGMSAKCHHGGAAFIWPLIQDYQFLDLHPMAIDINLQGALSLQNIRVNTPSTFTVGISTEPGVMENAAERLLGMEMKQVAELARDIIFGQMRVVLATMPIEEINADRDKLIENIYTGVEVELKKVGLRLINVNIQDITDESGYIDALGQEAAARAINEARVKVAEKERDGAIGSANAERDQRIRVAEAQATAVEGENTAAVTVANSNAHRRSMEAEAERQAIAAEKVKSAQALEEAYRAEEQSERQRAAREEATQHANIVVPAEIKKREIETLAEAEAERVRRTKQGEADGLRSMMEAEAAGLESILSRKASGFDRMVEAARGLPELAALLLVTEQLPKLVEEQVKAISNLKIDKVTVWEGGRNGDGKDGRTATADFLSGLVGSLPPLHELTKNVGVELPEYLGRMERGPGGSSGGGGAPAGGGDSLPTGPGAASRETGSASAGSAPRARGGREAASRAAGSGDEGEDAAEPPAGGDGGGAPRRPEREGGAAGAAASRDGGPGGEGAEAGRDGAERGGAERKAADGRPADGTGDGGSRAAGPDAGLAPDAAASPPAGAGAETAQGADASTGTGGRPPDPPAVAAEDRGRIRSLLAAVPGILSQMDRDRDGRVEREEVEEAVDAAFQWARHTGAPADRRDDVWYYAAEGKPVGPTSWERLVALGETRPDLPVNLDGAGFWLPYAAVSNAARLLEMRR